MRCFIWENGEVYRTVKEAEERIRECIEYGRFDEMCILRYDNEQVVKTLGKDKQKAKEISNYVLV